MKKGLFYLVLVIFSSTIFFSCIEESKKQDEAKMVRETKGSIFTTIQVKHVGNVDVKYVTDTVHNDAGAIVKIISHIDTIPQLAITRDTLFTGRTHINKDGDEVDKDTVIVHPKDPTIYIIVKN